MKCTRKVMLGFLAARSEKDAEKRHAMMLDAMDSARRSNASRPNASAQALVREATRAMEVEQYQGPLVR